MKMLAAALVACLALVDVVGAAEILGTYSTPALTFPTVAGPLPTPTQTGTDADAYAPYSTPRPSTPDVPYVECYVKLVSAGGTMVHVPTPDGITVDSATTPDNVICYRVTTTGGGILRVPIPHVSDVTDASVAASSPSNVGLTIVLPVVLSVVGAAALLLVFFLVRRRRAASSVKRESKGAWVRHFGWVSSDVESQRAAPAISQPIPQPNPTELKY